MANNTATRAKFRVQEVKEQHYQSATETEPQKYGEAVTLNPVYSPDPTSENHTFWEATPNGHLLMFINNPAAWGTFVEGDEFYIDFIKAE